jgi:AsmA protein
VQVEAIPALDRIERSAVVEIGKASRFALLADIHRGWTVFERTGFGLRFVKGVASIEEGKLENLSLGLGFGGTVDFSARGLDLHAVAMPSIGEAKPGKEIPKFRFDVGGSWDDLAFTPDVRDLIRRSGAATPLFSYHPDVAKHLGRGGEDAK